jgi:hypothetical protein
MYANLFVIRKTGKYGKGLFATRFVPRGTIVCFWCKKCGIYLKEDLAKLSKKKLDFVMEHEEKAGPGLLSKACDRRQQYINHSCNPHILETGRIGDIVIKDIEKGEEATEDYRIFYGKTYFKRYFKNGCKCGEPNCAKVKLLTHPSTAKLQRHWKKEINAAMRLIPYVKQPLKKEILAERPYLKYLFKKPS